MKMKNIFRLSALLGVVLAMTGCSEDKIVTVDPNGLPQASDYNINVSVDQTTNTFTLSVDNLKGVYPVWRVYANTRNPETPSVRSTSHVVTGVIKNKGDYNVELQIGNRNGVSEGVRTAVIHIDKDMKDPNAFYGYKYDSAFNLWKSANVSLGSTWFANNDWGELNPQPSVEVSNEVIALHTPSDMGNSQWQGQVHVVTDIPVSSDTNYDFSCYVDCQIDCNVTVKVQKDGDDDTYFSVGPYPFKAGGDVFHFSDLPGFDGTLKIAFDFGGYPDTDFEISNIVFKDHANDDGTVFPEEGGGEEGGGESFGGFVYDSDVNMWKAADIFLQSTWFANNDWGELNPQPDVEVSNDVIFLHTPAEMGNSQWQGQVHVGTNIPVQADQNYDFSCHLYSDVAGKVTVKVQMDGNDDVMFGDMGAQKDIKAGDNVIYFMNQPGFDGTLKIAFDFGGLIDSDIEVSDIVFKNAADDDGTAKPAVWDDAKNMWKGYDVTGLYYATGNDWSGLPDYEYERTDDGYWIYLPTETMNQWQAQMHIATDIMTDSSHKYDFKITFNCSNAIDGVTVKFHPDGDDGTFYMEDRVSCPAGKATTFKWENLFGIDADVPWVLTLDFGGNPADTEIEVSGIHFQEH